LFRQIESAINRKPDLRAIPAPSPALKIEHQSVNDTPNTPRFDIAPVPIEEEMKRSYLDYAMSVIVSRALPTCATA
jgi:hypothetical protein